MVLSVVSLPAARPILPAPRNPSEYYGATHVAAAYAGFSAPPFSIRGAWQHGWLPRHFQIGPEYVLAMVNAPRDQVYWVARLDEEAYLKSHGFSRTRAIGLPIAYLRPVTIPRQPGSLLVMPAHSLDSTEHAWREDEYTQLIAELRASFSDVLVCVHPSCWKRGYWVESFRRRGIEAVSGASVDDANSLERIRALVSSFEYLTTNAHGSHLAYGAALGAKVSIYGPIAEGKPNDFKSEPFFLSHPETLDRALWLQSEAGLRCHFSDLFCRPAEAIARVEWGREQIGFDRRLTPRELRAAFGWSLGGRAYRGLASRTPRRLKNGIRALLDRR